MTERPIADDELRLMLAEDEVWRLRMGQLEELVRLAVPAVRGAAKKAERKAAYDQKKAPRYFMMHLDRACLWRGWLNQAEALIADLEASMPEDFLRDFHNANDLADIHALTKKVNEAASLGLGGEWLTNALNEIGDRSED